MILNDMQLLLSPRRYFAGVQRTFLQALMIFSIWYFGAAALQALVSWILSPPAILPANQGIQLQPAPLANLQRYIYLTPLLLAPIGLSSILLVGLLRYGALRIFNAPRVSLADIQSTTLLAHLCFPPASLAGGLLTAALMALRPDLAAILTSAAQFLMLAVLGWQCYLSAIGLQLRFALSQRAAWGTVVVPYAILFMALLATLLLISLTLAAWASAFH